jgi:hypothetical protein
VCSVASWLWRPSPARRRTRTHYRPASESGGQSQRPSVSRPVDGPGRFLVLFLVDFLLIPRLSALSGP